MLRYSQQWIAEEDIWEVVTVLRSDWLTCGPKVREFEEALAAYCGAKYVVAVNSGTAALYLAYRACPASWSVTTSPLTFMATANAALMAGGNVHFVDVDPATGNAVFTGKEPGVIVPVHYAGRACAIPQGIVIEDACHALGAMDFDGCSRVGSCAHSLASCFSFHPVKPITTGEGGAVTTNDQGFADEVRSLRDHGRRDGLMINLSGNYRMPDINAVLGLSQLKRCDEMRERRFEFASRYARQIDAWDGQLNGQQYSAWHLYPIRIKGGLRDEVKRKLNEQGIGVQVHYNPPVHLHPYYRKQFLYQPGAFPNAEAWASEELSLPLHAQMTEQDVDGVVSVLREAL
jgi:dTDP-4-amino-4,6-dideoxygalactose transaminase